MTTLTLRGRLRRMTGRLLRPIARCLLGLSRRVENFVCSLEGEKDFSIWGRRELIDRIDRFERADLHKAALIERLNERLKTLEAWHDQSPWAREALIERLNFSDARAESMTESLEAMLGDMRSTQRLVMDQGMPIPAAELDSIAMGQRLAALEDHLEAVLVRLESQDELEGQPTFAFPRASDDNREKAAG